MPATYTSDVARGGWVRPQLSDPSGIWTVGHFVPQGYEAYVRIFHPTDAIRLSWVDDRPVTEEERTMTWRDVTEWTGTTWHPLMQWDRISAGHRNPEYGEAGWQLSGPGMGSLVPEQLAAVASILARHTGSPRSCTAGLWEGYGWIHGGGAVMYLVADDESGGLRRRRGTRAGRLGAWFRRATFSGLPQARSSAGMAFHPPPAFNDDVRNGPKLELPDRSYLLFDCGAEDLAEQAARGLWPESGLDLQSPNILWPEDRSWFLASEIDYDSTLVGGSLALAAELLRSPALEAARIGPDASLTYSADTINWSP